ncbi:Rha family transcriptional regulator [Leptolyngbya sp. FACHB-36]|nr:Rha family transcriptional regulator [Leptolyngbya sp. FACHB-36]MBD2018784.1 Rha family transcriptional regulator [Leptolyngbya sp. FACHB-36]
MCRSCEGALVVDSRLIAEGLGIEHKNFLATLDKFLSKIEGAFGAVAFETREFKTKQGNTSTERIAFLTEDQATFVSTLSRNTPQVVQFKIDLVKAFSAARRQLQGASVAETPSIDMGIPISESVDTLITEINTLYGQFEVVVEQLPKALQLAKDMGDRLLQLKAVVGHGNWEAFRKANLKNPRTNKPMSSSAATLYQRIAENWDRIRAASVETIRQANQLLRALPAAGETGLDKPSKPMKSKRSKPATKAVDPVKQMEAGIRIMNRYLGGPDENQKTLLKARLMTLMVGQTSLPSTSSDDRLELPISDRAAELGYTLDHRQLLQAGLFAARFYRERYGAEPPKREQIVGGVSRMVNSYSGSDIDLLDAAIQAVVEAQQS